MAAQTCDLQAKKPLYKSSMAQIQGAFASKISQSPRVRLSLKLDSHLDASCCV